MTKAFDAFASTIHPTGSRLLIEQHKPKDQTPSGFYLPPPKNQFDRHYQHRGTVLAVGPGRLMESDEAGTLVPIQVAPGEVVAFNIYGAVEVPMPNRDWPKLLLVDESNVEGVIFTA